MDRQVQSHSHKEVGGVGGGEAGPGGAATLWYPPRSCKPYRARVPRVPVLRRQRGEEGLEGEVDQAEGRRSASLSALLQAAVSLADS